MGLILAKPKMQMGCIDTQKNCKGKFFFEGDPSDDDFDNLDVEQASKDFFGHTDGEMEDKFGSMEEAVGNDVMAGKPISGPFADYFDQKCKDNNDGNKGVMHLCCDPANKGNYEGMNYFYDASGNLQTKTQDFMEEDGSGGVSVLLSNLGNEQGLCGDNVNFTCQGNDAASCFLDECAKAGYGQVLDFYQLCKASGGRDCITDTCATSSEPASTEPLQSGLAGPAPSPGPEPVDAATQQQIAQQILALDPIVPPEQDEKKDNTMLWVGLGIGTIFVIILVVIIIIIATKKKAPVQASLF